MALHARAELFVSSTSARGLHRSRLSGATTRVLTGVLTLAVVRTMSGPQPECLPAWICSEVCILASIVE